MAGVGAEQRRIALPTPETTSHFSGPRLRQLREDAGLSRAQVAVAVHRTEQTIWLWEVERTRPQFDLLPDIAQCLGCRIDDLFPENGSA